MKRYIYLLISIMILCSCQNRDTSTLSDETQFLIEKIDYNKTKIVDKMMLNPGSVSRYANVSNYLTNNFDSLLIYVEQCNYSNFKSGLHKLINLLDDNYYFDNEYIKKTILPYRFDRLINHIKENKFSKNQNLLKFELISLQNELMTFLLNSIESDYYRFNSLTPIVVDSSDNINIGDTYVSHIYVAAFDTTVCPSIMVADYSQPDNILQLDKADNKDLFNIEIINGHGVFKKKVYTSGKHGYKGVIQIRNGNGKIDKYMFEKEFNVKK